MFYVVRTADHQYAVLTAKANGSTCVSTYQSEQEAEEHADLMNRATGAEEEIEDVPDEMFTLLGKLS